MPNLRIFFKRAYLVLFSVLMAMFIGIVNVYDYSSFSKENLNEAPPSYIVYYPEEVPSLKEIYVDERLVNKTAAEPAIKTEREQIDSYIEYVCECYPKVSPSLVKSVIMSESSYNSNAKNGNHIGLMQISTKYHSERARRLGVTDFYDPASNVLLGTDYLNELLEQTNGDVAWALMIYNMGFKEAYRLQQNGQISSYASNILSRI